MARKKFWDYIFSNKQSGQDDKQHIFWYFTEIAEDQKSSSAGERISPLWQIVLARKFRNLVSAEVWRSSVAIRMSLDNV